jgi:phage portal protein BeeE
VFGKGAKLEPLGADVAGGGAAAAADRTLASVARFFGMQPWLVNAPSAAGSMVYSNTEAAGLDLVRYTLSGYRRPIEDGWSEALPGSYLTGRRVRLGLRHLTQPGFLERMQGYAIATGNAPWMDPAEVRTAEGMAPADMLDPNGATAPDLEMIPGGA